MLTTHEKTILAHFILQTKADQAHILAEAIANPKTSGTLIQAMRHCQQY